MPFLFSGYEREGFFDFKVKNDKMLNSGGQKPLTKRGETEKPNE